MIRIESVELSTICYATEDPAKLIKCFGTIVGSDELEKRVSITEAKGHYNDEIQIISLVLKGREALECAKRIFSLSDLESIRKLLESISLRFDGSKLFLRFSKFYAYLGQIKLEDGGDAIKVVIKFGGYLKGKTYLEVLRESNLLGEEYA